jgi:hypothetical protein
MTGEKGAAMIIEDNFYKNSVMRRSSEKESLDDLQINKRLFSSDSH